LTLPPGAIERLRRQARINGTFALLAGWCSGRQWRACCWSGPRSARCDGTARACDEARAVPLLRC